MHSKPSGLAVCAPGAADEWEAPETEEESVRASTRGGESELGPCRIVRNGFQEDGGIGRITKMQSRLRVGSGALGWAGPGQPSRGWHLPPPRPGCGQTPGASRSDRRRV